MEVASVFFVLMVVMGEPATPTIPGMPTTGCTPPPMALTVLPGFLTICKAISCAQRCCWVTPVT